MKHYWININTSVNRKNFMEKQFNNLNIDNIRVPAIIPDDFDNLLVQKRPLTCKYPGCNTCEYEFACLCSHIKAMQEGLKYNDDYFIIMEDDIYMPFIIDYESLIKDAPNDADIIQLLILYGSTVSHLYDIYKNTNQKFIKWVYLLPSTGMYIISRKGAQFLVDKFYNKSLNKYDFSSSPHQIVADVLLYLTVPSYSTTVPFCYPYVKMGSEIHPDHIINHEKTIVDIKNVIKNYDTFPYIKKFIKEDDYNF